MMIGALVAAVLVYHNVPADVARVAAYQWRAGVPVPLEVTLARDGPRLVVTLQDAAGAVVLLQRADGTYLLDGPVAGSSREQERRLDGVWRRTIGGSVGGREDGGVLPLEWLAANGRGGDTWPACWWGGGGKWACLGVPLDAAGVVVGLADGRLWSGVVHGPAPVALRLTSWGRLVLARDRGGDAPPGLKVSAAQPVTSDRRASSIRVETAALRDVRVTPVGTTSIWIAGDSSPPSAWIEVRSARSGPAYLLLADVIDGPPQVPIAVLLDDSRSVEAIVVSDRGERAAAALVTMFRVIDPPPAAGSRDRPPRRVFVSEVIAGADGDLRVDGLGDAAYEIVAWHPRYGRGSLMLPAGSDHVTIRLHSPGIARGRVLAGGTPIAGVDVSTMPDPLAFVAADDPIDLKGGDTRTGPDGRFTVTLAAGGGGELRVGGGTYPVRRVPLPRAPLPLVELGDIDLGRTAVVNITLDQDPACDLRGVGPIGRAGLQIVTATRVGPGLFRVTLPEEGAWEFGLLCGKEEHVLTPSIVTVTAGERPQEVKLIVK